MNGDSYDCPWFENPWIGFFMKKKKEKIKLHPEDYEGYNYGPFTFERIGRITQMSSNWKPEELKKCMQKIKNNRPKLKEEINSKISKLLSIIREFEPLELLATVSARNCFVNPEEYRETTHKGRECYVEYAQSLILSQKYNQGLKHATNDTIEQFNNLISEIFENVLWYFYSEVTEDARSKIEEEIRVGLISKYLFVRGDSIPEHHIEMMQEIFREHDSFLKKHCNFTTDELIIGIQNIENQLLNNVNEFMSFSHLSKELHELFKEFIDKKGINNFSSIEDCRNKYLALPIVQEKHKKIMEFQEKLSKELYPFEIVSTEKVPIELLKLLSAGLGDNHNFLAFEKAPAWPTNDSIIYKRPIIEKNGKFYCFAPQVLFRNMGNILEEWIQQKDNNYYQNVFCKKRSDYLENKTLMYMEKLLPEAQVFGKLYYYIEKKGERKRVEADGLVLYDENLFIIEAKAGVFSTSARRGSLERVKKDITELVSNAHGQALRTKQYIMDVSEPTFEFENGNPALIIKDKNKYKNIYLINVTLESLGYISAHLSSVKNLGLIVEKEWPWSVFINDLRIISDFIEFPSEFIHFLQRRIRANDYPQFRAMDELDLLMYYFYEGLYFENILPQKLNSLIPFGYTENLERYYDYLAGRVSSGKKPKLKIAEKYKNIVKEIELTRKEGFTKVTTLLLNIDSRDQRKILGSLEKLKTMSKKDGKEHEITLIFKELRTGLTFSVCSNPNNSLWSKYDRYSNLKMYHTKLENWITVIITLDEHINCQFDFKIYNKKWKYDANMEEQLKQFVEKKMDRFKQTGQKIGRNDFCPCGSGLKYKKCCGKL